MATSKQHREYVQRYRSKSGNHRLEIMISPELSERFKTLPGLQGKTHAERLAALCELWEQQYTSVLSYQSSSFKTEPAAPIHETSDVYTDLLQQLDSFDAQLAAEEAAEASESVKSAPSRSSLLWDIPLPDVPPCPQKWFYPALNDAITRLYDREWHRRKHGNSEEAKRWKQRLRAEPALMAAFRAMTQNREKLREMIKHCCLALSPNDLLAWHSLEEADRLAVLWYLVHAAAIYPEALGQVGERFTKAREEQPQRNFLTWELVK